MLYAEAARRLAERARAGDVCVGVHHSAMSPQVVELYGHVGLDFVIIASEVESLDIRTMESLMRAADAGLTVPIVKLRWPDLDCLQEAMNAGAAMVMMPHVTSRAQLDEAVRAARFTPEGTRGICPVARYAGYGAISLDDVRTRANASRAVIPIIEDREALDHIDEIVSCPDIDIVEIGPFDLSQSLGVATPARSYGNPETMRAVEVICGSARKHGKAVLAPYWVTPETDSPAKLVAWNREQLVSRGITMLYGLEVVILGRFFRELTELRRGATTRGD